MRKREQEEKDLKCEVEWLGLVARLDRLGLNGGLIKKDSKLQ